MATGCLYFVDYLGVLYIVVIMYYRFIWKEIQSMTPSVNVHEGLTNAVMQLHFPFMQCTM